LNPSGYLGLATRHMMRSLLDRLLVVVHASAKRMAAVFGSDVIHGARYREALIEASVAGNAALAAYSVQQELGRDRGGLRAVSGVYVSSTRAIWAPRYGSHDCTGLADPPRDLDEFVQFSDAVMRSDRIASLLA